MHLIKYTFSAILKCAFALLPAIALVACADDEYLISPDDVIPEGQSTIMLEAAFSPFSGNHLSRATTAPEGTAMNDVNDLAIVVYDKEENIVGEPLGFSDLKAEYENRFDSDASNGDTAEDSTLCIKNIPLTLENGQYYIVAVANLPYEDAQGNVTEGKTTAEALKALDISTLDKLRNLKVRWQNNYQNNSEMFGYFDVRGATAPNWGSKIPLVTVKPGVDLRAWLRRCASKITIDFDGSDLSENVHIYIKSARIYDIPQACTLGFGLKGEGESQVKYNNVPTETELIHSIEHVIDYEAEYGKDGKGPQIAAGSPFIVDSKGNKVDFHTQTANALFFYENMQGYIKDAKVPIADIAGGGMVQGKEKDGVPAGTYIEVVAEYKSNATGNIGGGEIKYRFMLGKDATSSFDAERNHHYKLTLKFHGNANDFDWHIDYKDIEDTWDIPQPWYVSYLYNHRSVMPFKYTPPSGWRVKRLDAEIIKNPWYAHVGTDENGLLLAPPNDNSEVYNEPNNKSNANGFLSLRETKDVVVTTQMNDVPKWPGYTAAMNTINNKYYYGLSKDSKSINRSKRPYYFDGTPDTTNDGLEQYSAQKKGEKMEFQIPLFTRAKVLVKQTGYSGNNPFVSYERRANIEFIITLEKIDNPKVTMTRDTIVEVRQVRRIVNPKGVYRRSGNNEDFAVHLLELHDDDDSEFSDFKSDGPWMAEIVGDQNFITLDGKNVIHGSTNESIKFNIRFNKLNKDDKVRNAVVRVLYNSYTCTHLIFVRQGYSPQALVERATNYNTPVVDGQRKTADQTPTIWRTFNMISRTEEATDPRDEGSLFKFGNSSNAIDAVNNVYTRNGEVDCRAPKGESGFVVQGPFWIADYNNAGELQTDAKAWNKFAKDDAGFTHASLSNLATIRDFEQLYGTPHMQFGYGVLYADGATTTQTSVNDAYGYYRKDPANKKNAKGEITTDSHKGMRGMFAYYWNIDDPNNQYTANNVFFPIGRSGYGHRKEGLGTKEPAGKQEVGMLRYCALGYGYRSVFKDAGPLFCSLFHRPGAIYYAKNKVWDFMTWDTANNTDPGNAIGLDINYFSFDVNAIQESNLSNGADACFLRQVGNY